MKKIALSAVRCNSIVTLKRDIKIYVEKLEKVKQAVQDFQAEKHILFFENINMPIIRASSGGDSYYKDIVLDRIEMHSCIRKESGRDSFDFALELFLYSDEKCFSFIVAKTEKNYQEWYVSSIEEDLEIKAGNHSFLKFVSVSDFHKVILFCDKSIAEFKELLVDAKHFNYHLEKM